MVLATVANDRAIDGSADDRGRSAGSRSQGYRSWSANRQFTFSVHPLVETRDLPRVRAAQPVVRLFYLPTVLIVWWNMPYS